MRATVQEIFGTNITGQTITHYKNGTETTKGYSIDVDTGQGNGTSMFIAANLTAGDLVYTGPYGFPGATINETIFRTYLGKMFEVNHLNLTMEYELPGVFHFIYSFNFYWFKSTGAVCEFQMYYYNQTIPPWIESPVIYESTLSISAVIVAMIPEFPTWTSIVPILTVLTVVAVVYKRKYSQKRPSSKQENPFYPIF